MILYNNVIYHVMMSFIGVVGHEHYLQLVDWPNSFQTPKKILLKKNLLALLS